MKKPPQQDFFASPRPEIGGLLLGPFRLTPTNLDKPGQTNDDLSRTPPTRPDQRKTIQSRPRNNP